jgi:transcription elongation GreA/GreB family factor
MSRAFTKEIDDAPGAKLAEIPISDATNLVTPRGAAIIVAKAGDIAAEIARTSEPEALERLRRDQRYWEARRASMQVLSPPPKPTEVAFGTTVKINRRGRTSLLHIVGEDEASPSSGFIAWTSPLARALAGAEAGETVEFDAGGRPEKIEILLIEPQSSGDHV